MEPTNTNNTIGDDEYTQLLNVWRPPLVDTTGLEDDTNGWAMVQWTSNQVWDTIQRLVSDARMFRERMEIAEHVAHSLRVELKELHDSMQIAVSNLDGYGDGDGCGCCSGQHSDH